MNICSVRDPAAQLEGWPVATRVIPTCRQIVLKLGPDTPIFVKSSNVITIPLKQVQGAEKKPIHAKRHLETQLGLRYKKRYGNKVEHNWTHFNTCTPDIHTTTFIYTVTHSSEGYTSWSTILPTSHELLKHGEVHCSQMTETMAFYVEMIRFNNIKISTYYHFSTLEINSKIFAQKTLLLVTITGSRSPRLMFPANFTFDGQTAFWNSKYFSKIYSIFRFLTSLSPTIIKICVKLRAYSTKSYRSSHLRPPKASYWALKTEVKLWRKFEKKWKKNAKLPKNLKLRVRINVGQGVSQVWIPNNKKGNL